MLRYQPFEVRLIHQRSIWRSTKYVLLHNLHFEGYTVPSGFVSNGASVPRPFRWALCPMGPYAPAAFLHDYLIDIARKEGSISYFEADRVFKKALLSLHMPWYVVYAMYVGVAVGSVVRTVLDQ